MVELFGRSCPSDSSVETAGDTGQTNANVNKCFSRAETTLSGLTLLRRRRRLETDFGATFEPISELEVSERKKKNPGARSLDFSVYLRSTRRGGGSPLTFFTNWQNLGDPRRARVIQISIEDCRPSAARRR